MKIATANVCNYLVEAGIIFLIIFAPIYYGSVTLWTITVIELTILFMLLIWGISIVAQGKLVFRRTPIDIPILAFCVCSAISALFFSKYQYVSYMGLSLVLCISALYFIVVNHIRSERQLIRLFLVIILAGFVHAFSHLAQNAAGLLGKSTGVMLNVGNHFAGYMVIIIPLAVGVSFVIKDEGKRMLLIFAGIVMAASMAFSLIAGAMLAFLLSLILIALQFIRWKSTRKRALILGIVVLCSVLIILWFGHTPVLEEFLTVTNLKTGSPAGRLSLWKSSLAIFADNPVTGTGLSTFDYIYPNYRLPDIIGRAVYAHSDWLQLLTEMGVIGIVIVLAGAVIFFISILKRFHLGNLDDDWMKGLIVGGLSSVGAGLAHALVEFNFHIPAISVLFAIIVATTFLASSGFKSESKSSIQISIPILTRINGFVCLLLIVGFASVSIIRPCVADSHYKDGAKFESDLRWDEAAGKYRSASRLSQRNSEYFYALANVYSRRVKLTKDGEIHGEWYRLALDACHRAVELCPKNGNHHLLLASLHESAGNAGEADAAYVKAISLDPNNAFYRRLYGGFCFKQDEIQRGVSEYKKSIDIYPTYLYSVLRECYVISNEVRGSDFERQSFLDAARGFCPEYVESLIILARFCMDNGWYDEAFSEYQQAVALEPERVDLRKRLSSLLLRQDRIDEAASLWERFLIDYPQDAQAYAELAAIYIRQKRTDDAISQYLMAADTGSANTVYSMKAADLYMRQGKSDEAMKLWQAAIEKNPYTAAAAYYRLGGYYEKQGDWLTALDYFQRAIGAEPKNASYRSRLAQSYYSKEMFYEAIQEWERALGISPESVSLNLQLARAYRRISRQDKSKDYYRQVLQLQPDNTEAQEAISIMENPAN